MDEIVASTTVASTTPKITKGKRQTENTRFANMRFMSGVGLVTRRNRKASSQMSSARGIEQLGSQSPLSLLRELPAVHPTVGLAQWNALRLMFPEGGWGLKAFKPADANGVSSPDPDGDAKIQALFDGLPREIGKMRGLAGTLSISLLYTGMACQECVPYGDDEEFAGVRRIWPVDALTIGFARKTPDDDLTAFQFQRSPSLTAQSILNNNWVPLNPETFMWAAIDQEVDDPFGLPPYGTAVNEVLADLALMRDLRDAIHNAAWPRLKFGINLTELHRVAVEVMRITSPEKASQWVQERFDETVAYAESLGADDNFVCDTNGTVESHEPGSFTGLEGVLQYLRQRLVQALKSLPTLLGINDGSTYNYTSVEWAIYAAGLEALRDIVLSLLADAASLHLRLSGSTSVARPFSEKIRTNDALVEANTEEVEIRNALAKEAAGFIDHDEASQSLTNRKAVKPAVDGALEAAVRAAATTNKDGSRQSGNGGPGGSSGNNSGTSKEERAAKKNG